MKDGGPAFPLGEGLMRPTLGMSLRDYFAAAALPSLQMWCLKVAELGGSVFNKAEIASMAYEQADAMLAERSKP